MVLLTALGTFKVFYGVENLEEFQQTDGTYYLNVASHVRDGDGLATDISLYHKGYREFPHPTSVAPLWPLLLGALGVLFPLLPASIAINSLFYFVTLLVGYRWARRNWPEDLFGPILKGVHAGHVWILVMGFNADFFRFTSLSYTEGLAFSLLLLLLLRAESLFSKPGVRTGLELGVWLGLLILSRGQMLLVAIAAFGTLGLCIALGARRAASTLMAATAAVTCALVLLPEYLYIQSFVSEAGLASLVRFDQNRVNDALSAIPVLKPTDGLWSYIKDRAPGFLYAYDPSAKYGFNAVFNGAQWIALISIPASLFWVVSQLKDFSLSRWRTTLLKPRNVAICFSVILALGAYFSLHTIHKVYSSPWNFGRRQALIAGLLFFVAFIWMLRRRKPVTYLLAILVLVSSSRAGALEMERNYRTKKRVYNPETYRQELVDYLVAEARRLGRPLVVAAPAYEGPQLALKTGGSVHYHWVYTQTSRDDYLTLFREFNVDYVIMPEWFLPEREKLYEIANEHRPRSGITKLYKPNGMTKHGELKAGQRGRATKRPPRRR